MTLQEIFNRLNEIALKQPNICEIIDTGNIYDLNSKREAKFGVFCVAQGTHSYDAENALTSFNLILYYVDRLKDNGDNKIQVQSIGIETLKNIVLTLAQTEDVDISECSFTVFTESFSQLCAGAYATVKINSFDEGCVENFE